jgi:hypothetical protein
LSGRLTRRAALVALAGAGVGSAAAQPLPGSFENWRRLFGGPQAAADAAERSRLLAEGEALLANGDAIGAQDVFQRAAMMMHAADTECSIVRAQMQAGQYRQALSFGAHAALAHRGFPGGVALYAWLLHAGGQSVIAARLLDEALTLHPGDQALQTVRNELAQAWPRPSGPLLAPPLRSAPYAHGAGTAGAGLRCAGTATLARAGHAAVLPLAMVDGADRLWLRNGLGTTVGARIVQRDETKGLALAELTVALPVPGSLDAALRAPFAGSPVATVEYATGTPAAAAWPLLRQGFLGRPLQAGESRLGIALPDGPRGGPVFDRAGRLAGIALALPDGAARMLSLAAWPFDAAPAPAAEPTPAAGVAAVDVVYESALRVALQVLVEAGG